MNGKLVSKAVRFLGLLFVLVVLSGSAVASVITTGDVAPAGAAVQSDPWAIEGNLKVGDSGIGTLNVAESGVVSNTNGYLVDKSGSTGMATVTGAGSKWNNSRALWVGNSGTAH